MRLALASTSPRRLALLRQAGIEPRQVLSPDVDETPLKGELPADHALRLAGVKADAGRAQLAEPAFVVAADTVVACGRRILPKAATRAEAEACLRLISGRRHRVHGGLCVIAPDGRRRTRLVTTSVRIKRLTQDEISFYLASGEWEGKAGGYAIQGLAATFVPSINGSYTNVVGLPLAETVAMLEGLGWSRP
ncbi:Maf family protein [Marinimicrococcus flavescens]|uniref:dTTP/UTP pyrophosphatase n=1 Tax=Marinimicrococcus flavescens TaxID=3031815 RepID=A0AAP3XRF9_9PROT|nr:Maf family protein [Marinimicrococcus flavescens]